jgi:hypothetical protein
MTSAQAELARPAVDARGILADYWTPRRAIAALVTVGLLLRVWVVSAGWFYWDDYIFQGRAWRLGLDADYLLHGHDGHLMPGAFLLQWPLTRVWPMEYLPLALVLVAGQVLVLLLFARLALRLWGPRWLTLVPVALVAVTPLTLPTNTWWAAALNGIPMQLALTVALLAVVSWWRTGRQRHLWLALLVWLVLLSFSEKVLVVPWAALAVVPVLDAERRPVTAWLRALRRTWVFWAVVTVLTAGYVVAYSSLVGKQPAADALPGQVADLVGRGVATSLVPAMLGGPLDWEPVGFGSAVGHPPTWLVLAAGELLAVLVVSSVIVSRRSRRAWVWAGAYVLGDLLLVASGRLNPFVDPVIVQGLRYTADAAVPVALAVGTALVGVSPSLRRALLHAGIPRTRVSLVLRSAVVGLVTVMTVLSLVSVSSYRQIWRDNASRPYIENVSADLAANADGPSLIDQPVPVSVLYGLAFPYNQASWLLSPIHPRPEFGDPTTLLRLIDDTGHIRPALVAGPAARPGPVPGCGWYVAGSRTDIPLTASIVPFTHTVRVGYIATEDGSAALRLGSGPARAFVVHKGLNEVVMTLEGGGPTLSILGLAPGTSLCTDDVRVGSPTLVTK